MIRLYICGSSQHLFIASSSIRFDSFRFLSSNRFSVLRRLILAHFAVQGYDLLNLVPFLFLCFSFYGWGCSRIRFSWPKPNERMTKTNSPQSELFYGVCHMHVCLRDSLFLSLFVSLSLCMCVCALICNAMNASTLESPSSDSGHSWCTNLTQLVI